MEHLIEIFEQALKHYDLGFWQFFGFGICALIYGLSKGGVKGLATLAVPLMAFIFGGKSSTGIVVPMLVMADFLAVPYYSKYANWKHLFALLPWTFIGIILGVWIGDQINEDLFRKLLAVVVLVCVIMLIWWESKPNRKVPTKWWFAALVGIGAGFTTMVGNAAGAFVTLYLIASRLPKMNFIGTVAWLFLIINLFKIPFHIFVWETISKESLALNAMAFPMILIGFFLGTRIVRKINEKVFKKMVLILTGIAAFILFLR